MPAWAILGATAITAGSNIIAGDKQSDAYGDATSEEGRQFDLQWDAQAPYREAGENALTNMALLTGAPDPRAAALEQEMMAIGQDFLSQEWNNPYLPALAEGIGKTPETLTPQDAVNILRNSGSMGTGWDEKYGNVRMDLRQMGNEYDAIMAEPTQSIDEMVKSDPSYDFRYEQGKDATQNYLTAGGQGRWSGNALRAIDEYGQDFASTEYANIFNRNATIAGFGPAATQTPQNNISAYTAEQGNIAANQITGVGNAVNTGITNWVAYDQNQQMLDALGQPTGGFTGSQVNPNVG